MLIKGPFTAVHSNRDGITLSRDNTNFTILPAEADMLGQLVQMAMRIESYPVLPSRLQLQNFECKFFENRTMEIQHQYNPHVGLAFSFAEGDDLIWIIRQVSNSYLNAAANTPQATKNFRGVQTPDPLF